MSLPEDEIDAWGYRQRRAAALRILAIGLAVFVPALIWLWVYANWDTDAPITRIKVVGGVAVAIGGLLALVGGVLLVRARRPPVDPVPTAIARERPKG